MIKNAITKVLTFVLVVLLAGGGLYFYKSSSTDTEIKESDFDRKTLEVDGKSYFPRQDIATFLIMGIDKMGVVESSKSYRNDRNADVIMLIVFDQTEKSYSVLCLNRDTMVEMPVLGVTGENAGKVTQQLSLSHTYGSGLVDSCENARDAVSGLLNNVRIDNFISMNMDGIQIITDALGGVEVNIVDDFSEIDENLWQGTHLLNGQQAITFVRSRKDVGNQLNTNRMERQKEYLSGVEKAFKERVEGKYDLLKKTYEDLSPYMVSDCSITDFSTLVDSYMNSTCKDIIIPDGVYKKGDEFMEFYIDEEKFQDLLIDLLYKEKDFN